MRTTITETGGADPAVAWSRYENLALWTTWSPQIQEVIAATPRIAPGLNGLVVGPLGIRVPFEVLSVDAEAMEWSWHVRPGPVDATLDHAVRPAPGGCSTELVIDAPAFAVIGYRPLAALALRRLVRSDL
ncbi:SRPBCC family protein [Terrabacter sp. C0L_2]|uniref:SRPBCC family protein n=1 Tax=Terrabacter sp. C0L_2 TaxID=3108389 RepID=UPI002ED3767D|nr:SRPBCC family protein [Terrabacter sp. C0L_2]